VNASKMTRNAKSNTVELEFPFGLSFEQFYCPACGKAILEQDEPFEAPKCQHLEWIYLDGLGEFVFAAPVVQERIDILSEKAKVDDDFDLYEELQKIWASSTKVIFSITTGGMAGGPIWETVRTG
jgi:predicted RNA-binding Zn-ribbon protein involved in translation (DUF1610 family)